MKGALKVVALGLGGLALAVALSLGAFALAGHSLGEPATQVAVHVTPPSRNASDNHGSATHTPSASPSPDSDHGGSSPSGGGSSPTTAPSGGGSSPSSGDDGGDNGGDNGGGGHGSDD